MATSKKITELPAITAAANTDIVYIVHDPAGVPVSNKITVQNLFKAINAEAMDTKAATAYTNSVAVATSLASSAYSNSIAMASDYADSAFSNAIALASDYATAAYTNAIHKSVSYVNSAVYEVSSTEEILMIDAASAGADVTVVFPNSAANGKVYTVKSIAAGLMNIIANGNPAIVEDPHNLNDFSTMANSSVAGSAVTWVYYDGYYRVLSFYY